MVNGGVQCVVLLSSAWLSRHFNQTVLFQLVLQSIETVTLSLVVNRHIGIPHAEYSRNSNIDGQVKILFL